MEVKALQIVVRLSDEALSCLLLICSEDRGDSDPSGGPEEAFWTVGYNCRRKKPGETVWAMANDTESLGKHSMWTNSLGISFSGPFPLQSYARRPN